MKVMLHEHNIPLKQNMEKAKKIKHVDNIWNIFEDQRQSKLDQLCSSFSTGFKKIRKPEVAPLEVKVDLFSIIGLGGAQQLLSISQWELFFIHGVSI